MPPVPWPTSSNPGRAPGEGAGRLVNCFAYKDGTPGQNGQAPPRWRPLAGLAPFIGLPVGEIRGALATAGLLIVVAGQSVYQVDNGGGITPIEQPVAGDGPVTLARNNAAPPQVVGVSSVGAFAIVNGVVQNYPSPASGTDPTKTYTSLPQVNSVTFLDGYFLFTTAGGQIIASDLNTTAVQALSYATAEARPDGLLRGIVYGQLFFAMGTDTIEVWQDVGATPFPLTRVAVIPQGLLGPWAVAGYQPGWAGPLLYVAQDNSVRQLDGYTPTRVSSEDLERLISQVTDPTTLRANVYTSGANAIFSLSSPDWTWEFNITTGLWHERIGYGGGRWRGAMTASAFGDWIVADADGGALYRLDPDARQDGPDPLIWGMDSGPVRAFPARIQVPGAYFDFVLGDDADPSGDPAALLSWSHDGGATWANPLMRSIGRQGGYRGRVSLFRMGLTSPAGIRLRFRVSDPAYTSFSGATMDDQVRR